MLAQSLKCLALATVMSALVVRALPQYGAEYAETQMGSHQLVLGEAQSATQRDPMQTEPDFVDLIVAEAHESGRLDELVDKFGFSLEDIKVSMSLRPLREESLSNMEVDLDNQMEKAKLMAEAAAEDTLAWIQPVESPPEAKNGPGSGWIWSVCGSQQEAVVLKSVDVKPDPPIPGQNLTVHATGTVNHDITQGTYADVVVKLGFIRLLSRRFDICQLAEDNDAELKCPLKPGEYELTHTVELPKEIPPAKFNVHTTGKTAQDNDLLCMDLSIDFSHH